MRIVPETKTADETGESAIRHIAIVSPYSFVRVWDLANWRELWSARVQDEVTSLFAFAKRILAYSPPLNIRVLTAEGEDIFLKLRVAGAGDACQIFTVFPLSKDEFLAVFAYHQAIAGVYTTEGECKQIIASNFSGSDKMKTAFSPAGFLAVSSSGNIDVYAVSGELLCAISPVYQVFDDAIGYLVLSHDGNTLVTGGINKAAIWRIPLSSPPEIVSYHIFGEEYTHLPEIAVSPNGRFLALFYPYAFLGVYDTWQKRPMGTVALPTPGKRWVFFEDSQTLGIVVDGAMGIMYFKVRIADMLMSPQFVGTIPSCSRALTY